MKNKIILLGLTLLFITIDVIANNVNIEELKHYVFPENVAKSPKAFSYMPDEKTYLILSDDGKSILQYGIDNAKLVDTILDINQTRETSINKIQGFKISPCGKKILVYNNVSPIYRRSFEANYYIFEINRNILKPLSTNHKKQRAPIFSNDGRMVAFVAKNNIYIKKLDYDSEVAVTTDGKPNSIINGVPDWTYEEEFMVESSMVWSPDNLMLCYVKYDEQDVLTYSFPIYGGICDKTDFQLYPSEYRYKYPKSGTKNSKVSVYSYDVETRKTKSIGVDLNSVEYIPMISYTADSNKLAIATLNRNQNIFELLLANPKTTVVKSIYKDVSKAWIEELCYNNIKFYPDYFVVSSARSGFNHLYKYSYSGVEIEQLTSGNYDVLNYYGNDKDGAHYFLSTKSGAINRQLLKIDKKGKLVDLSKADGCASASFSPMMNYYVLNYSNSNQPPLYTLYNSFNKEIRVLEANKELRSKYSLMPKREFFTITHSGIHLNAYIIKPVDFDENKEYPLIMTHYNGPSSQIVLNEWAVDWENYYAMQGYIIVCVDGRGTGGRGQEFQNVVYKNLGHFETIDIIEAANYMSSKQYVDSNRIGIYGWSYGGYETLMAISQKNSPYCAAVAVAPVTDWRFYDTAYTERFMQTPQENEDGYIVSSTLNKINNVKCPLLIMSGTADDNVHLSNTMEYVSSLIEVGKYCDLFLFPNMNHSINKCGTRVVVYAKMLDYFNRNLVAK